MGAFLGSRADLYYENWQSHNFSKDPKPVRKRNMDPRSFPRTWNLQGIFPVVYIQMYEFNFRKMSPSQRLSSNVIV